MEDEAGVCESTNLPDDGESTRLGTGVTTGLAGRAGPALTCRSGTRVRDKMELLLPITSSQWNAPPYVRRGTANYCGYNVCSTSSRASFDVFLFPYQ
jgi:hypothetical protein